MRIESGRAVRLLAIAYAMGVAGALWDWREHLIGGGIQPPHFLQDAGGVLALAVLAFVGHARFRARSYVVVSVLFFAVLLVFFGPFALMMFFPRTPFTAAYMRLMMTGAGLGLMVPLLVLAGWAAWRWLRIGPIVAWRIAGAGGLVLVAVGAVIDLYWHENNPMTAEMRMNMLVLPGHQIILGGFLIGLLGSAAGLVWPVRRSSQAKMEAT
jgi:hypothetical protein